MVLYAAPCNYQVVGILLRSPYIGNDQRQAVFSRLSFQKLLDLWEFGKMIYTFFVLLAKYNMQTSVTVKFQFVGQIINPSYSLYHNQSQISI